MRRAVALLVSAIAMVATFVLPAQPASAAVVSDVGVTLSGRPVTVAPSGQWALYEGTIRNNGVAAIDVNFTDTTTNATVQAAQSTIPSGCNLAGNTMTCSFTLLFNEVRSFAIAAETNVSATPYSAKNVAQVTATAPVDEDSSNNSRTVTTPVSNSGSIAFLPGGGLLNYQSATVKLAKLTNAITSPGIFADMSDAVVAPGTSCGGGLTCGPTGLHIGIVQDSYYKALDVNDPLRAEVVFGKDPCNGMAPEKCTGLSWRHLQTGPAAIVGPCASPGVAFADRPCLEFKERVPAGMRYMVLMTSHDPDLIPPLALGK